MRQVDLGNTLATSCSSAVVASGTFVGSRVSIDWSEVTLKDTLARRRATLIWTEEDPREVLMQDPSPTGLPQPKNTGTGDSGLRHRSRKHIKSPSDRRNAPPPRQIWRRFPDNLVWRGSRCYGRRQARRTDSVFEFFVWMPVCTPVANGYRDCRLKYLQLSTSANGHTASHALSVWPQHGFD